MVRDEVARFVTAPSAPRRWFFWLVPVLATLVAIGFAEILLALFWPVPFASENNMYYLADPELGYRLPTIRVLVCIKTC